MDDSTDLNSEGAAMFHGKAKKFLIEAYRLTYIVLGLQGAFRLFGFWGWMAFFVGLLLGIGVIFFGGLLAILGSKSLRWVEITDFLLMAFVDLFGAAGLFYGAWNVLHWHWIVAALSAFAAFVAMRWLTRPERNANRLSTGASQAQSEAKARAEQFVSEIGPDRICEGKVTKVLKCGAIVTFAPEVQGWLHVSQIPGGRQNHVSDVFSKGDQVKVKAVKTSEWGVISLSMMGLS